MANPSTTIENPHLGVARAAQRPQGRKLTRPLPDRDRQRVHDHGNAPTNNAIAPKREQEVLQEVEEALGVLRVRLRLPLPPS